MSSTRIGAIALATLVLLAGCTVGVPGSLPDETGTQSGPAASGSDSGTVHFYVSDEENAIGDFRHLNVTITRLAFVRGDDGQNQTVQNRTGDDASNESAGKVVRDVDARSIDLTRLQGENATMLNAFSIPDGTYTKVFAYVTEVNATLDSGEHVRVKLPSEKLQLNKPFVVRPNASVNFVFDMTVHKAGKSGKYILQPVVAESGTDVPIKRIDSDDKDDADDPDEDAKDDRDRDELRVTVVGNASAGENATLSVTRNGTPVENATVFVDDESVGTTDADGQFVLLVPAGAEELEVKVTRDEAEGELEIEFEADGDDGDDGEPTDDGEEAELQAEFVGTVERGENATLRVSRAGSPVENATVTIDDRTIGNTDQSGRISVALPDEEEVAVTVRADDDEVTLEAVFADRTETNG